MKFTVYIVIGGAALLFGAIVCISARHSPFWARCAFLLFGILGAGYGLLGYCVEYHRASLDFAARAALDHYRTLVAGVAIGIFLVLLISGQIQLAMKTRQKV